MHSRHIRALGDRPRYISSQIDMHINVILTPCDMEDKFENYDIKCISSKIIDCLKLHNMRVDSRICVRGARLAQFVFHNGPNCQDDGPMQ